VIAACVQSDTRVRGTLTCAPGRECGELRDEPLCLPSDATLWSCDRGYESDTPDEACNNLLDDDGDRHVDADDPDCM
jgi:hypothetical protein